MTEIKKLRREMLEKRNALKPDERVILDSVLQKQFEKLLLEKPCEAVFLFASYGSEPNTYPFMDYVLENGLKLFLPRVLSDGTIDFFLVENRLDLIPGYKGILEPAEKPENQFLHHFNPDTDSALVFVPGAAVDSAGNRIGYGGGCYDRFLADYKDNSNMCRIYLGYPFQKSEEPILARQWDIPVELRIFDI